MGKKKDNHFEQNPELLTEIEAILKSEDVVSLYMDFCFHNSSEGLLKINVRENSGLDTVGKFKSLLEKLNVVRYEENDFFNKFQLDQKCYYLEEHDNFLLNFKIYKDLSKHLKLPLLNEKGSIFREKFLELTSNLNWNINNDKIKVSFVNDCLKFEHSSLFPLAEKLSELGVFNANDLNDLNFEQKKEILDEKQLYSQSVDEKGRLIFNDDGKIESKFITPELISSTIKIGLFKDNDLSFEGGLDLSKKYNRDFAHVTLLSVPKPTKADYNKYVKYGILPD